MALTKVTGQVINDSTGLVVGVTTVGGGLSATDGFFSGIVTAVGDASFSGNVSVGGTLTYEDVTNIDAVGLVTARNGIVVGSGITLSKDGDGFFTGVVTATSYAGDGSGLTGIAATDNVRTGILDVAGVGTFRGDVNIPDKIIHLGDTNTAIRFPAADTITAETGGNEVLRITSGRDIITQGLTDHSFNNDGDNAKVLEITGDGTVGEYGVLNISGNQNSSANVGAIKFLNRENSNSSSGSNANSRRLASIDCFADTSDSNGGDDSGGFLRFVTKADGGGGGERLRIGSAGQLGIAGANYGTSGQVLQSQGSSSAVQWATPAAWVYGTAADYDQWGSTTDVQFSGWPSTWQEIRVSFNDVSVTNNAYMQFFVSKSSSTAARITSGYQTTSGQFGNSNNASVDTTTTMGRFSGTGASGYSMTGYVSFYKFSGTIIRFKGDLTDKTYGNYLYSVTGYVTCDPTSSMTHIFFRGQGYSYDAGKFKLDYLGS